VAGVQSSRVSEDNADLIAIGDERQARVEPSQQVSADQEGQNDLQGDRGPTERDRVGEMKLSSRLANRAMPSIMQP